MMDEDTGYVRTAKEHHGLRKLVLKHGHSFAILDPYGEIDTHDSWEAGVYHHGTRHLSRMRLLVDDEPLMLLSSRVDRANVVLNADLTNPDLAAAGEDRGRIGMARGTLHLNRRIFLSEATLFQRLVWHSFCDEPIECEVRVEIDADYVDLFEVRGVRREKRGEQEEPHVGDRELLTGYRGLDGLRRTTCTLFSAQPRTMDAKGASFSLRIDPQQSVTHYLTTALAPEGSCPATPNGFDRTYEARRAEAEAAGPSVSIETSNERLNDALDRAEADLAMLSTRMARGRYPFAGIPWFSTVFGRDGLWTALMRNWTDPGLSCDVLRVLAGLQATETDPQADAEPGKILHEMREGEMPALGEVPFRRYYGSVDATPLFVMLADLCVERTDNAEFALEIWPAVEAALGWMDRHGDRDGDGFLEYHRATATGLDNQGWKDSGDAIMHADGTLATGPIALVEVQAYAFAAKRGAARLARRIGRPEVAARLGEEAEHLRERFERQFWCEEIGTYALALDGGKRPCAVVSSNVGHVLYCGIASPDRARRSIQRLMEPSMFTGWGLRTLSLGTTRYNPMSYHNGSVWPHDTAIAAAGFARYGDTASAARIADALIEAADDMDMRRLPELFCGFERQPGTAPTLYPVACSPQAWSSAALFSLVNTCLGLKLNGRRSRLVFTRPTLPRAYDRMLLRGIGWDDRSLDLKLERRGEGVTVEVLNREGEVDVEIHM